MRKIIQSLFLIVLGIHVLGQNVDSIKNSNYNFSQLDSGTVIHIMQLGDKNEKGGLDSNGLKQGYWVLDIETPVYYGEREFGNIIGKESGYYVNDKKKDYGK
jgi:hypothetical protein